MAKLTTKLYLRFRQQFLADQDPSRGRANLNISFGKLFEFQILQRLPDGAVLKKGQLLFGNEKKLCDALKKMKFVN
jgi:hypothetical protein